MKQNNSNGAAAVLPGQRSGSGGGQAKMNSNSLTPLSGQGIPGASQSNSFQNIQKMNNRLRARNPVLMSMPNGNPGSSPTNQAQQFLPLSNRSISPNSYQQLQNAVQQQQINSINGHGGPGGGPNGQQNQRKPGSISRKMNGGGQMNSPTTAPSLNDKYGVGASHVGNHSLNGSYERNGQTGSGGQNNSRAPQITIGSHNGPLNSISSPTNNQFNNGGRERGNSLNGGYHNFHPNQQESANTGHSIIHGSNHFNQFNMNREGAGHSRHMVGASLDQVNMMQSNDSSIGAAVANSNQSPTNQGQVHQVVLSKKIIGNRKRNAREKSYDSYNQKLQLPPMIKTPQDRTDRTYSVPSAPGQLNQQPQNNQYQNNQNHQYMLPLSPGQGAPNSITPKTTTHAQMQRQSINEGLADRNGPMIQGQNNSQGGQNGNQIFSRFSNIQLQNSLANKNQKISGQGGRAFQSVNNFFNPRTAGAQKHPQRERISTHHFQGNEISPHNSNHHHPISPSGGIQQRGSSENQGSQNGSIFLKNTFSPRMKIGAPPGSSGLSNSQHIAGGPVKAAHQRMGRNSIEEQQRSSPTQVQGTSLQEQSPVSGKNKVSRNNGSPTSSFMGSAPSFNNPTDKNRQSRSRPRQNRQNIGASINSNIDSRSVATPQADSLSTSADSKKDEEGSRVHIPTPLSSEENKESNIQFVEVQTLLFGENPAPLNPKTIQLKNHEPTKASQKKCGIIKSYAANTNQGIIRDYNEDRVSIILNILKPKNKANLDIEWPQICFFGVFDGHGGSACADYLRDNLHNFVVQNEQFPQNPIQAIKEGFHECERNFLSLVEQAQARAQHLMTGQNVGPERSGSCANVVMIIDEMLYIINVGDSRAMMSIDAGAQIGVLSRDHKPDDELEKIRIQAAGGKIYRTQTFAKAATTPGEKDLYVQGPLRVFPGRLSVSKTFGDIEAKRPRYGGNPNVIVCDPDIKSFKIQDNFDFIMIGCDGIFERLNNRDCIDAIWDRITEQISVSNKMGAGEAYKGGKRDESKKRANQNANNQNSRSKSKGANGGSQYNEHQAAADGVEIIIRAAAASRSLDNITSLILGLKGLKRTIQKLNTGQDLNQIRQQLSVENSGVKNTYLEDFAFLEQLEPETGVINEAISIANSGTDKKRNNLSPKSIASQIK